MLVGVSLLVTVGLSADAAWAECAMRNEVTFAPPDNAQVPMNPTLYVFVHGQRQDTRHGIWVRGARSFSVTEVSRTRAFVTYRVDVESSAAGLIQLEVGGVHEATYHSDRSWQRSATMADVEVVAAGYSRFYGCPAEDAYRLTLSHAPAYRVEWAESAEAFELGGAKTVVFPHHIRDFVARRFSSRAYREGHGYGVISLGDPACLGPTARFSSYPKKPPYVRITGLFPDGSTTFTPAFPQLVWPKSFVPPPLQEIRPSEARRRRPPWGLHLFALLAGSAAIWLAFAVRRSVLVRPEL